MKKHALIITGAEANYPVGYSARVTPIRSAGGHRIASHLRDTGEWDVEVLDFFTGWNDQELRDFVDMRIHSDTMWIGFSVFFTNSVFWEPPVVTKQNTLIRYIKHKYPHIKIVVGANKLINVLRHDDGVDYFCIGNGEHAIVALCNYFVGRTPEPKVLVKTNPMNSMDGKLRDKTYKILDCFRDFPAYPHRNPKNSYEERDFIEPYEVLSTELSRGCMFKCTFCDYAPLGVKGDHTRDADNFYDELLENYEKWGVTHYVLSDETSNDSTAKLQKFADTVKRLPFQPMFHGFVRGDLFVQRSRKDWDNMITMGLTSHAMGIETFNQKAGKSIRKGYSPLLIQEGLLQGEEYFRKNVLPNNHYNGTLTMIAGLPNETMESLDDTTKWLNKYWKNQVSMHALYISQHVGHDGIDAVSDIEQNPSKYGYTWRNRTAFDTLYEQFYFRNWQINNYPPTIKLSEVDIYEKIREEWKNRPNDFYGMIREETKERSSKAFAAIWVHPSGDYDHVDMIEYASKFAQERIYHRKQPESQCGWHMHWYRTMGFHDLRKVYNGKPPLITDENVQRYDDFIENYKKQKLNWYK